MSKRAPPEPVPDTVELEVIPPRPPLGGRRSATLVVVLGSDADLGAHVRVEHPVTIGRDPAAELTLSDAGASKQHVSRLPSRAKKLSCHSAR